MHRSRCPWWVSALCWFSLVVTAKAQNSLADAAPLRERPRTVEETQRVEGLKLYAVGLLQERDGEVLDAVASFEKGKKLDPRAAVLNKALVPLYQSLGRFEEALQAAHQAVEQAPDDFEAWHLYAAELRTLGKTREATEALAHAVECPNLKEVPGLFARLTFDLAKSYEDTRDYPRALAAFEKILANLDEDEPEAEAAEVHECIARLCLQCGRLERALQALRAAQDLGRAVDSVRATQIDGQIAPILYKLHRPAEALQVLDRFLLTQPAGAEPYELKIRILSSLGRERDIMPALQAAVQRDSHNVALTLLLASRYVHDGQYQAAADVYARLLVDSPTADVYCGLFSLNEKQGRIDDVLKLLNDTIVAARGDEKAPGNAAAAIRARAMIAALRNGPELARALMPATWRVLEAKGKLADETRQFLAALAAHFRQFDVAETLYRSFLEAGLTSRNEAAVYGGLIQVLWQADKFDDVVALCRRGLRETKFTNRLLLHSNLSRALILLERADEALAEADRAVQLSPAENRLRFRLLRAEILKLADRYDAAEQECLALLKDATKTEYIREIRSILSNIYSAAKAPAKAEEQLRLIMQIDPEDPTAYNDLGYLMADQNRDLDEAEKFIRQALTLDEKRRQTLPGASLEENQPNAAYVDSLGWLLFRQGRLDAAWAELEKAIALPDGSADPVVSDHLGDVYFRLGQRAQARAAWKKAISLYETKKRRKRDAAYDELKHKLHVLESETHQR